MIPKLHYISQGNSPKEHLENIQKACSSGAELVQLHLTNISEKKHLKLATAAREITSPYQTRLIINEQYEIAKKVKADGVHFVNTPSSLTDIRKHLYPWQIIGATANSLKECESEIEKDVDYITLAPFKSEENNLDNNTVLGLEGYTTIIAGLNTETPIIGFGGIKTDDVKDILATGISGIGVSDAITEDFDNIGKFNQLLSASSTAEKRYTIE
ncbi:MAG: thiamine phosphate synthase [Flavobacteriaceae bacterium]|nr:thiamine phosphate synthase [Flavobacteriaceae bacterium]